LALLLIHEKRGDWNTTEYGLIQPLGLFVCEAIVSWAAIQVLGPSTNVGVEVQVILYSYTVALPIVGVATPDKWLHTVVEVLDERF
jgi:hypothetical protein